MTTIAYLAALIAVLTIAAAVIGIAILSHFGPEYFGGSEDPHI